MSFTKTITDQDLREAAKSASSDYLREGTSLTDAVVKAASGIPSTLTDEHVKRLCEMTYHETYERMFRNENGSDRLITFDPPNAKVASARLRAEKVASATVRLRTDAANRESAEKTASAVSRIRLPRVFAPTNVFDEKTASAASASVTWNDPYAEARLLEKTLRDQSEQLKTASASSAAGAQDTLIELLDHAGYAHAEGVTAAQILELAMEGAADSAPPAFVQKMASVLADGLRHRKIPLEAKVAGAYGEPNLKHPIAVLGAKVAHYLFEKAVADEALVDINAARLSIIGKSNAPRA